MKTLANKVAVVTGASRGGGKGIATALGEAGATIYVTGSQTAGTSLATRALSRKPHYCFRPIIIESYPLQRESVVVDRMS